MIWPNWQHVKKLTRQLHDAVNDEEAASRRLVLGIIDERGTHYDGLGKVCWRWRRWLMQLELRWSSAVMRYLHGGCAASVEKLEIGERWIFLHSFEPFTKIDDGLYASGK